MSARELAIVLLRVVGIYLLIHLVTAGPAAFWALGYLLTSFDQSRSVVSGVDWLGWSQIAFTIMARLRVCGCQHHLARSRAATRRACCSP